MSAETPDTGRAPEAHRCLGKACLKRQAGKCTKAAPAAIADAGTEDNSIPAPAVRVERRSKLRQLLMQNVVAEEKAQSLVEFALTIPILLIVVTGIAAFSIAFDNYIVLTEATSVGARQLTVSRGQTLDPCNTFATAVYGAAPMLKRVNLTFTVSLNGTSYPGTSCSSGSTYTGAAGNMVLGTNAVVTVTYPVSVNVYGYKFVSAGSLLTAQITELMQ